MWQGAAVPTATLGQGAFLVSTLVNQGLQPAYIDGTVVRIRGVLSTRPTSITTGQLWAAGIMVANDEAVTTGYTALPNPILDTGADWIWWSGMVQPGNGNTEFHQVQVTVIDNKSMRKMPGVNKRLVFVFANFTGVSIEVGLFVRSLVKLH